MEKLLQLLNEYDPYIRGDGEREDNIWYLVYKGGSAIFDRKIGERTIISRSYGFIEWLVENDKIDLNKVKGKSDRIYYKEYGSGGFTCSDGELVLMLLSISSSPIEDLISYLK